MISAVDAGNQQIRLGVVEVADVRQCELESPPRCHTLLSFALLLRLLGFGSAIQHVMRATLTFVPGQLTIQTLTEPACSMLRNLVVKQFKEFT